MPIPEQFIDELVARSEISDVVSSYVNLRRSGRKGARHSGFGRFSGGGLFVGIFCDGRRAQGFSARRGSRQCVGILRRPC